MKPKVSGTFRQKEHFLSQRVNDTLNIGRLIAKNLNPGDIICLFGGFGSGKTVLTQGIAKGLGIIQDKINSPSFVLIRRYHTKNKIPFYHFDLYRLKQTKDILDLGYEEYFYGEGITVVEWADRLKFLLPKEYLKIKLEIRGKSKRQIEIIPLGKHYRELRNKICNEDIRH